MTVVSDANQEIVTEGYLPTELLDLASDTVNLSALDAKTIGVSNNPTETLDCHENVVWDNQNCKGRWRIDDYTPKRVCSFL
ncbi:MAG TPA: hypothetical protein VJ044_02325 [Candidatus Hodarchaeales archaeon]|nr:hypothetical protein [Candidatus Hodarchaeales archaeon]